MFSWQRGYPDAHILPEYIGKTNGIGDPTSLEEKDAMFVARSAKKYLLSKWYSYCFWLESIK